MDYKNIFWSVFYPTLCTYGLRTLISPERHASLIIELICLLYSVKLLYLCLNCVVC